MRSTTQIRLISAAAAALLAVAALLAPSGSGAGAATALPTGPLVPKAGTSLLGVTILKGSKTSEPTTWSSLEAASGGNIDVAQSMYQWGQAVPSWRESYQLQHGRIPLISWGWVKSTDVTSGKYDSYIRSTAAGIKALGGKVFIRWFWEMDGKALASYAVSPAAYKAAWAHIHAIFVSAGATNAVWVWTPTSWGFDVGRAAQWYPGSTLVDWVGADGFNWYPERTGSTPQSFAQIFSSFYKWGLAANKPMMVAATGALENSDPMAKANWIKAMASAVTTTDPGIRAICYLDTTSSDYNNPSVVAHWEITSSTNATNAWNSIAKQAVFANAH
jgi:hypothetical protein